MSERPPPSPAQVALALAATGRVDAAHVLLQIALDEDPGDDECAEALDRLASIELHPLEPEETPRVFLGPPLVDAYVQGGLLREAQVIAQTLWSMTPDDAAAVRRVKLFEQALAPLPPDAPDDLARADALLREGAVASALLAFRDAGQRAGAPAWVRARAEALRALVITRDAPVGPPSGIVSASEDTTRVGRDPRRVIALLHERNLAGAAAEADVAAAAMGGEMAVIAQALARLVEVADRVPRDSPESRSTLPMGRQGVADLHVRMANFDQAIALYRAVVEANPHDDDAREVLSALRVVTRHLRTVSVEQVDSVSLQTPSSELTRPALESAPTVDPSAQHTREIVLSDQVQRHRPAIEEPTEPSSTVERTLNKTGWRPPAGDWSMASHSATLRGGDDETAITSPEVAAELALRQGYPERALALYRELARARPEEPRYAARIASIERTLGLVIEAPPDEPTVIPIGAEPAPTLLSAGALRTPTGPYRSAPRRPDDRPSDDARGGERSTGFEEGLGPTVSPRAPRDTAEVARADVLPRLPDMIGSVIATSEAARIRSPFDGLDEEATAVNLAAADLVREGLLVGPEQRLRLDPEPLPALATRVEELAPPTVRLPAVSEALARQMQPSKPVSVALRIPVTRDGSVDEEVPPTFRGSLVEADDAQSDTTAPGERTSATEPDRPAVAARRIIPIGD